MSAVNHWWGIWPGTCSLLGLYTRRLWLSAEEFKFQGGYSGKTATSGPIYDLTEHSWESCRWVKTCVIMLPEAWGWTVYVWTFNQWETTVFRQRLRLVAEITLAGELIWIWRHGCQQGRRLLCECQTAVGSPRMGNILRHPVVSHRCLIRGHRRVQGVTWRSSMEVTTDGRRHGGCWHQHTIVSRVWKQWRHLCRWTGTLVQPMGSSWIEGLLLSKDWNLPPTCKTPDCREDHRHGCSRNINYRQDQWIPWRARTYCVRMIFCGIMVFLHECVLNVWKVIFLELILTHLV